MATTKYWIRPSICAIQIWWKMCSSKITSVSMWTNRISARNSIRWWPTIRLWQHTIVGAKHVPYWHRCWRYSKCVRCFRCWTIVAWNWLNTWKRFRRTKMLRQKVLPHDLPHKMSFDVRLASIHNVSPMSSPSSVTWARKSFSRRRSVASNWCSCPFVRFYVIFCHLGEYGRRWFRDEQSLIDLNSFSQFCTWWRWRLVPQIDQRIERGSPEFTTAIRGFIPNDSEWSREEW